MSPGKVWSILRYTGVYDMDLYELISASGSVNGLDRIPGPRIDGYSSLIWTERYLDHSSFELKSKFVLDMLFKMSRRRLFSIVGSNEIMMSETLSIADDANGYPEITVTGRSLTSLIDYRVIQGTRGSGTTFLKPYTGLEAALVYLWNNFRNNTSNDVAVAASRVPFFETFVPYSAVTDSSNLWADLGNSDDDKFLEGKSGDQIRKWLSTVPGDGGHYWNYGLRMVKPPSGPAKIVSVVTDPGSSKGTITRTNQETFDVGRFDVYSGQETNVRFNFALDMASGTKYLFSNADLNTIVYNTSGTSKNSVYRSGEDHATGYFCRYGFVDSGDTYSSTPARDALYKTNKSVQMFDALLSPQNPYKYGVDYNLGDAVYIYGDYDQYKRVIVDQYVRVDDADGDRGYPMFVDINPTPSISNYV